MNTKILENLWLNKIEIEIYLKLLNLSEISKQTWINRPQIYSTLPSMIESWLISEILKGKRKYYIAWNPKILKDYLNKIENDFNFIYEELGESYEKRSKRSILQALE